MTKKIDLKLGFTCNNNCRFCVVAHKRKWGDRTTEEAKQELKLIKVPQNKNLVLTGGEVTIREDILEIIGYAKSLGFKAIDIQTNGRMCSSLKFAQKLVETGTSFFLVSIHGWNKKAQDFLTRAPGSFAQTTAGIKNLAGLNVGLKTNTVINKLNYKHLSELARLLIDLGVKSVQLTFPHGSGNAWDNFNEMVPTYLETAPYIHKFIDLCRRCNVDSLIRDVPFCFMEGYEEHIDDVKLESTESREIAHITPDYRKWRREEGKAQGPPCKGCKYSKICEGPWRDYIQKREWSEFKLVK